MAKGRLENMGSAGPELVREQLEQRFGKGTFMRLGEQRALDVKVWSAGSILLDEALGCGGYPRGRVVEIYGPESSGKTTLTLHAIAECQRAGGTAAFIDAEHALDPQYASQLGVNVDALWVSQPDYGEQALEIVDTLAKSGCTDVIVVDSVAALAPQLEVDGEIGEQHVGLQARMMSQALRKLAGSIAKSKTTVFFINQIRTRIGVMYGNPEITAGGNALKFYASMRLEIRRGENLAQSGEDPVGHRVRIRVVKNKVAPPFRRVELDLLFGRGISRESGLVEAGLQHKVLQRSGSWVTWADKSLGQGQLGQGRENARRYLESHPELADRLEQSLRLLMLRGREGVDHSQKEQLQSAG